MHWRSRPPGARAERARTIAQGSARSGDRPSSCSASMACLRRVLDSTGCRRIGAFGDAFARRRAGSSLLSRPPGCFVGSSHRRLVRAEGFAIITDPLRVLAPDAPTMIPSTDCASEPISAFRGRARRGRRPVLREAKSGRRDRRGNRGVAGVRAERHGAQGRRRDDRVQPRQGHRRHRLRRRAARSREHGGFRARGDQGHRRQGADDRALHRRRRVLRARRSDDAGARLGRSASCIIRGTCRSSRRSSWGANAKRRRSPSIRASPTPKAPRYRCTKRSSSTATATDSRAATRARATRIYCSVIGEEDDAMQRDDWYTSARSPADLEPARDVGRKAGERTRAPTGRAQARDDSSARCSSRRRSRPGWSDISSAR